MEEIAATVSSETNSTAEMGKPGDVQNCVESAEESECLEVSQVPPNTPSLPIVGQKCWTPTKISFLFPAHCLVLFPHSPISIIVQGISADFHGKTSNLEERFSKGTNSAAYILLDCRNFLRVQCWDSTIIDC